MAKLKSKLFSAMQNPLAGRGHGIPSLSGISASFYTDVTGIVMRTKPKNPPHTSPSQIERQQVWGDGDCMWRSRTKGQDQLFWSYYSQEYKAGRTKKTARTALTEANQQIPHLNMNRQSFFMSHALKLDLYDFLTRFLESSWELDEAVDNDEFYDVRVSLVNPADLFEATLPFERGFIRGR